MLVSKSFKKAILNENLCNCMLNAFYEESNLNILFNHKYKISHALKENFCFLLLFLFYIDG